MIFKTNISKNQNYKPTVYVYQEIYTCKKKTVTSVREATVNNLNMLNENVFPFFSISQNKGENVCETEVTIHRSLQQLQKSQQAASQKIRHLAVECKAGRHTILDKNPEDFQAPACQSYMLHRLDIKRCTVYCLLNIINIPKETFFF